MKTGKIGLVLLSLAFCIALAIFVKNEVPQYQFSMVHIDVGHSDIEAECMFTNLTGDDVFLFGEDKIAVYFLNDGAWKFCSAQEDVGCKPVKGLLVKGGDSARVGGTLPKECMQAKWFAILGMSRRGDDEMEERVASDIYLIVREKEGGLTIRQEKNSVFKKGVKATIVNE